jgi:hypothetical protein
MKNKTYLKNASKCPGLRCPAQVEILTYSVYAPFSIHGTPCPVERIKLFNQDVKSRF